MKLTLQELLTYFQVKHKISDSSYQCKCPTHNDEKASLTISEKDGKLLLYCHAGCCTEDILTEVGLNFSDIEPNKEMFTFGWKERLEYGQGKKVEAIYDYKDENRAYLYSKVRFEGKIIRYLTIDRANNTYEYCKQKEKATLYHLPELIKSIANGYPVYIVEGEKDVDTLTELGYTATTAGSVSDWKKEYAHYFTGAKVVILPDNDKPGLDLKDRIMKDLKHYAHSIHWTITSEAEKGDVTDYLKKEGHSKGDFEQLVLKAKKKEAPWIYYIGKEKETLKINADILADSVSKTLNYLVVRRPEEEKDDFYYYSHGVYQKCNKTTVKSMIRRYIPIGLASDNLLNNAYGLLLCKSEHLCNYQDLNKDRDSINLKNGLYNLKTGKLEPHSPKVYSTIQLNCNYNPDNNHRPIFEHYINDLCRDKEGVVDKEKMRIIQEYMGAVLSNSDMSRLKLALVLFSLLGNSGKTQLLNLLGLFLGTERIINIPIQQMNENSKFTLGSLPDKRLISIGDQTGSEIQDSAIFKQLTGGDPVKIEPKGKQPYSFIFRGGIIIACNNLPGFRDDKGGHVFERLCIIPCEHIIPKEQRDNALLNKMSKELDAIFNWCLEGVQRLIKNDFRLTESKACNEAREEYRSTLDTVHHYLKENYLITNNKMDMIPKAKLEEDYIKWCSENTLTAVSKRNIKDRMEKNGCIIGKDSKGIRCYRYLKEREEGFKNITEKKDYTSEQMKIIFG